MPMYDVLLVGGGLFNAVLATRFVSAGKKVCVIERRDSVGGNCYTKRVDGINIHQYGAHIFHTSDKRAWKFANRYGTFAQFINSPVAMVRRGGIDSPWESFNLPFNMNTFSKLWGCTKPEEAMEIIKNTSGVTSNGIHNLRDRAISMVGEELFELFIRGYTEKQWGKRCEELPQDIITRIPVRYTYDNNYFNDWWQGIPTNGYTDWILNMFSGTTILTNTDYLSEMEEWNDSADIVFYSGRIDELFDFKFGQLPFRSLRFDLTRYGPHELQTMCGNYQGVAVANYTQYAKDAEFTRIIEHKHFEPWNKAVQNSSVTWVSREYPMPCGKRDEAYYPISSKASMELYTKYLSLLPRKIVPTGRLGLYRYNDMDDTIIAALEMADQYLGKEEGNP